MSRPDDPSPAVPGGSNIDRKGLAFALGAYGLWGLLPVYWKLLQAVPAVEILLHRMVWSLVSLAVVVAVARRGASLRRALSNGRALLLYLVAATLLAANWGLYIWAVNAGHILETSLGYFINPLMNVLLGVALFRERLRRGQWVATAIAALGVVILGFAYGRPPWIALFLASSFAVYAVLKKRAPLGAIEGLTIETALMFLPALAGLGYLVATGTGHLGQLGARTDLLLICGGAATAVPLVFFAAAAHRLPLSVVGILQYVAPTLQFLLGVLVYEEPVDGRRLAGFVCIWLALAVFTVEGVTHRSTPGPVASTRS